MIAYEAAFQAFPTLPISSLRSTFGSFHGCICGSHLLTSRDIDGLDSSWSLPFSRASDVYVHLCTFIAFEG